MVMPARVICCIEVPLDERKRGVHHRPSWIALVARRQELAQEQYDLLSETPQTHRWVMYIFMNHPNATKAPESLPRMRQGPEGLANSS